MALARLLTEPDPHSPPSHHPFSHPQDFSLREAMAVPGPGMYKPRWLRDGSWRNVGVKASVNLAGADL